MSDQRSSPEESIQKLIDAFKNAKIGSQEVLVYKGCEFLPGLASPDNLDFIQEWDIPENSVFISTYPKTGSTWCIEIVRNIFYLKDEKTLKMTKQLTTPMLMIEMPPKEKFKYFEELPMSRKYFFTHLPEEFFNYEKMKRSNSKMIYAIRNPKDQAVSWYHFTKKIPLVDEYRKKLGADDWNKFLKVLVNGEYPMGLRNKGWYPDHILGWMKHRDDENFLLVEYEAMTENLPKEVRRMAKFLDVELTDDEVNEVAKACTFDTMKKQSEVDESGFLKMNLRQGGVGGWKDQFTVAQSEMMDELIDEKLKESGIKFKYVL